MVGWGIPAHHRLSVQLTAAGAEPDKLMQVRTHRQLSRTVVGND